MLHRKLVLRNDAELERVLESGRGLEGPSADHFIERVNRPDSTGATPLHAAISSAAIAATVKAAGPKDPWAPDSGEGQLRCLRLLLSSGASVERKYFGRTALHLAAAAILDTAAAAAAAAHAGSTALHLACAAGDSEVVRALLAGGASSSARDGFGRSAAGVAARCGFLDIAEPAKPAIGRVDTDTEVTAHSLVAALHAAGGAVQAVADVCASPRRARNAFCAVRPPGHHAGPRGAVGGQSAGFCLLSTAAIGAAYALACRREVVRRVAILDYDVHHGNGTQECVRNVRPTERVESFSAAGATLRLSRVECKPWLSEEDGDNVFFGSIHGFGEEGGGGGQFYPGSGGPVDQSAEPSVINSPVGLRTPSAQWRRFMSEKLLTPLAAFGPDLVIISAGFDAHAHDPLEAGALLDSDFEWMTAELVGLAERCCDGRLVSLLEGGYQTAGGPLASLGRAAAAHVAALMDPTLVGVPWDARACGERLESGIAAAADRRSKRSRTDVDYTALQAEIEAEEGGGA
ncbi:hypothetical protein EMIHUDRAFT_447983 [Emiliania huxleyi CCMP1516]|uniref:Histone deacetylase domain-containing protein n=2 Tax=Emiliania huxleyi TaxID=2903 RepID=A0A0D3J3Z1_EMIH1|nr:hypothetical protein EMIHUDRAFT_447983 [Emiliania huxleyi CCMP1516]EOD18226.1 hypothetical protein EMIHUDRAFT_447983 [Emiliania huxleyi CCMP1516]|eukprot:XP_005770655.1 hypothetical protein EMIHUDRAFT_447983 [Emiliania huxleyi CCMP1516]